ncbi:protein artichoke-like [Chironomus tepperi]|uniref:protein artichoke-like n=1 Tax=Chironomus tepperi TaxID=113505 RepID=UPI00391EE560
MEIKLLIVLFAIFGSTLSQSINCEYNVRQYGGDSSYACTLALDNPQGWDNFTQIGGRHFPGMNNVFVTTVIARYLSVSRNVPQIICSQFPHVTYIDLSSSQIEDVDENSFRGCRNLDWLRLYNNRIARLPENLFVHNRHLKELDLQRNLLTTLPENLLANQVALEALFLDFNPITTFPSGVFRSLWNLKTLILYRTQLNTINPAWFQNLINLDTLDLTLNPLNQAIPGDAFQNLNQLTVLYMAQCGIRTIDSQWFRNTRNLAYLTMFGNEITSIPDNMFNNMIDLYLLDLGINQISQISASAFDNLPNLLIMAIDYNAVTSLHPRWFIGKTELVELYLDFNFIPSLPNGIFTDLHSLNVLNLWRNNIRTISRSSFGTMQNLRTVDIQNNQINSIDERFLREATNLYFIYINQNLCINRAFFDFNNRIEQYIQEFTGCIRNFGFNAERITEAGSDYNFVTGFNPGMHVEVNSDQEIRIALTPFDFVWIPMLEIVFDADIIRVIRNRETQVAAIPNTGIFIPGAGNRYRITWSRQVVLVFEGSDEFPFLAYTMQDWFPTHFLGLRSEQSRASWSLEPLQIPALPLNFKSIQMELKVLIVLLAFVGYSLSQSIRCEYNLSWIVTDPRYSCVLNIQNPNGWDNFTQIEGTHYPGMSNTYVTIIYGQYLSSSRNVPQIICSQFPFATLIQLAGIGIEEVHENAFRGCRNLEILRLYNNRIPRLPENLLIHNRHLVEIDLERNLLTTLPENIFENQLALEQLILDHNPITNFPSGVFRNLWNLKVLFMYRAQLTTVNPAWFRNLFNLEVLDLDNNHLNQEIPGDAFENLGQLQILYLASCSIRTFNPQWFRNLGSLVYLIMFDNEITEIPANSFANSPNLLVLDIGINMISEISPDAFTNLPNLMTLSLDYNDISSIHPRWFEGKRHLSQLYFDSNSISSIPIGAFTDLNALGSLSFYDNRIRTINRNSFGTMQSLRDVDFENNVVNSIDERFLREASRLYYLALNDNDCIDQFFWDFVGGIEQNIQEFTRCIRNFGFSSERITQAGSDYNFVTGFNPGMHVEVNSAQEIRIALTPFDFVWIPMLEIVFNADIIRVIRNRETEVAIIPNLGVFTPGAGNRYRITWSRQVVLVFEGTDEFPFLAYTMQDWFPTHFLGLRSEQSRASWFLEPIQIPQTN